MKKNIWIETSYMLKNKTGIGAYILTIIDLIKDKDYNYKLLDLDLKLPYRYIWQTLWLNTVIYFKTLIQKPDIFISPNFIMPFFTRKKTKYITVIHDLCYLRLKDMEPYNRFVFKLSTEIAIKKADVIVAVSQSIKQELINKYNVSSNRVKVVYNTIADYFFDSINKQEVLEKYDIESKKYIFSVATINKRKNIPELIKAFESISDKYPDLKLVLVGGMGNENREKLTKHPKIIFTGYIPDDEVPTLYKNALLYMYPSLYEGFGIPLIEAQYCGCPVLCSDIPVFREVAGESAEFCNTDAISIAEKMEILINNPQRQEELINLGKENVKRFEIEKIEKQIQEIIKN